MITSRFGAMGTQFEVITRTEAQADRARAFVEEAEQRMSRFRPDSELSVLNAASSGPVKVSAELAACLTFAADLRERTGGLVDVGIGAGVLAWGYDRPFASGLGLDRTPGPTGLPAWSISGRTVTRSAGTYFDLGGIGKGWTADRAVELGLAELVSAGGDVRSGRIDTIIDIRDPWGTTVAGLALGTGGLATSSTARRRWQVGVETVHHILDPATGAPARTPVLSATAMTNTATEAEAAAKAVLILGVDGLAWAADQPWIRAALAIWEDGNVYATAGLEVAA